ncbi:MAG TPA: HepT-like ribonuclease domain-containing protein [Phycisphaerae bacterium]|nr:HepT-like ribonuclease domain-containing protein [Phycisphaerae bacterium]
MTEITRNGQELKEIVELNALEPGSIELKAAKYILIELAEAMSNCLQHLLAKQKGIAVNGYIDTIAKSHKEGILSEDLFGRLKPFFDFRNSLIHRYWTIDDRKLIENIKAGQNDFDRFADEIESYLASIRQ